MGVFMQQLTLPIESQPLHFLHNYTGFTNYSIRVQNFPILWPIFFALKSSCGGGEHKSKCLLKIVSYQLLLMNLKRKIEYFMVIQHYLILSKETKKEYPLLSTIAIIIAY